MVHHHETVRLERNLVSMEKLIGVKEMSEAYGLPVSWIYSKAQAGMLPHYRIGKYVRFRPSEIEAWLDRNHRAESINKGPAFPRQGGTSER